MREELADTVHQVLHAGLRLKDRLDKGQPLDFEREQRALEGLLLTESEARRWPDYSGDFGDGRPALPGEGRFVGARYALACWLDEVFILDTSWGKRWNEHKLETKLFGTNIRASEFWEQVRLAEARQGNDALEVYYLCVMLGFRGQYKDDPVWLKSWAGKVQPRLMRDPPAGKVMTEMKMRYYEPHADDLPLSGRKRFQWMVMVACLLIGLVLPAATFFLVLQLRGGH